MPIKSRQFALVQNTATNLLPTAQFPNQAGVPQDPIPVSIKNEDATAQMWIGGPDVSATNGQSLNAGQVAIMNLYNADTPWVFTTASSTPIVSVMVGRQ